MTTPFLPIPDWFSFENQGGNIASADLTNSGRVDLVMLMVDATPGQNRGLYRIARDVDDAGVVQGGWTGWLDVPDWFSWENQGVGVAVADLNGDGTSDLVVFMIDAAPGKNAGFYRVGKSLDEDGNVAGWGPWIEIPDWFSFENQHGAIALADLDADGSLELVVLTADAPEAHNRGVYRVGRKLDPNGNVTGGWSAWRDVDDWFSWENQGVGVALADLKGTGSLDLIAFQIDGAVDQNQAFFKVGAGLDVDGNVTDWSLWRGVPGWFAWENQGGGCATVNRGGRLELAVLLVDNPPGLNASYYRFLPLDEDASRDGRWEMLSFNSGVLAVHAALLPFGKVLFFAGSGSSQTRFRSHDFGDVSKDIFTSVVWDPAAQAPNNFNHPPTLLGPHHRPFDFFCGGDTLLADGKVFSVGGTLDYAPFLGRKDSALFDPATETWSLAANMAHGRWYPSVITLGDGSVLAASGLMEQVQQNVDQHSRTLEIYQPATNHWKTLHFQPNFANLPLYAHLFLLDSGKVFFDGGHMDDVLGLEPCIIDLTHAPVATKDVLGLNARDMRNQSASVLLPPAQEQRVMLIGGGPDGKQNKTDAVDSVDIVDFRDAVPRFTPAAPLGLPRLHLNAVLLPDRTVFVTGGSLKQEDAPLARLQSEIYDPSSNEWTLTAAATVPRLYHSTALLLPDGRVVAAGGNPEGGHHVKWNEDEDEEMRLEVFSPPYLFRGARPSISGAPLEWKYGQTLTVQTPDAANIAFVSLVRNGVTTHSYDNNQRLVDAPIAARKPQALDVTLTQNPNLAPPGHYMLFLVNTTGVPSVARWIHIS
jgi:Domain of unknown function (DUF1929)